MMMPLDTQQPDWNAELHRMQAEVTGDTAYSAGWDACMAWEARVPPEGLAPEAREQWLAGYDTAMDAPLGSGPTDDDLMQAGVW